MADRYLLPCSCGQALIIEPRHAGQTLPCECGEQVRAPGLSKLRALPRAEEPATRSAGGWGFRQGVLTAGLLIAAGLAAGGGYVWSTEPMPLEEYDPGVRNEQFVEGLDTLTPAQAFILWPARYAPLARTGFETLPDAGRERLNQQIAKARLVRWSLLGVAGAVVLASLAAFVSLPASGR